MMEEITFHIDSPMIKYHQNTSNSCCFVILVSSFESINQIKANNAISKRMEESLTSQVGFSNCIDFVIAVLKNKNS